jgi:hypothetical protein
MSNEQTGKVKLSAIVAAVKGEWDRPYSNDPEEVTREMMRFAEDDFKWAVPGPMYNEIGRSDGRGEYGRIR